MKRISVLTLVFILGLANTSAAQPTNKPAKVITAEEFVLVNAQGKPTARLATNEKGKPMLTFLGEDGAERIRIGLSIMDDPVLELVDRNQSSDISFGFDPFDEGPNLTLSDKFGSLTLGTLTYGDNSKYLGAWFYDKDHETRSETAMGEDGNLTMRIFDSKGANRFRMDQEEAGNLVFSLMNEDSRTALILGVAEKGQPAIHLMNWKGDKGTVRARLMLDEDGNPDLSFTNENKEIIKSL